MFLLNLFQDITKKNVCNMKFIWKKRKRIVHSIQKLRRKIV